MSKRPQATCDGLSKRGYLDLECTPPAVSAAEMRYLEDSILNPLSVVTMALL